MPIHHNWRRIAEIEDPRLRLAFSLTPVRQIPQPFPEFFPECFAKEKQPLYIPLSALMFAAGSYATDDGFEPDAVEQERHFVLTSAEETARHLRLPTPCGWNAKEGQTVPGEVLQRLVGQKAQAGMLVTIDGEEHLVVNIVFRGGYPEIGSVLKNPPDLICLYLRPVKFVAMDR